MKIYRNKKTVEQIIGDAEREITLFVEREIDATLFDAILLFGKDFGTKEIVVRIEYEDQNFEIQTINKPLKTLIKETLKADLMFDDQIAEMQQIADALRLAADQIDRRIKKAK
jgi:hypothetical protein